MSGLTLSVLFAATSSFDYVVIAVFLLGFTLFLFLQARHFRRIEDSLAGKSGGKDLTRAITSLKENKAQSNREQRDFREVESRLGELCMSAARREEALGRLEERLFALSERLHEVAEALSAARVDPVGPAGVRSAGLLDAIEQRLYAKGFSAVTLVDDLEEKDGGEHRISVEVVKENVPYKGTVTVVDGRIVEERLLPIYEAFP